MGYSGRQRTPPYQPGQKAPYRVSRSKIELFKQCPRCFWLDARYKISRPEGPRFTLNLAVDDLLKKEFDALRKEGKQHQIQIDYGLDARPVQHDQLNVWRHNFTGVQFLHSPTNFLVFGAIDDLWQDSEGNYIVLDYKATSKADKIEALGNESWHHSYRRQLEVYQWLLRQNGLKISNTGYWVYCNALKNRDGFDAKLEFEITLIKYDGSDKWVVPTLSLMKQALESNSIPNNAEDCIFCSYAKSRTDLTINHLNKLKLKV